MCFTFFFLVLYQIVTDLFTAGTDTVTNMLRWVIFFMAKYPEITRRCQEEIDKEVPLPAKVTYQDKPRWASLFFEI